MKEKNDKLQVENMTEADVEDLKASTQELTDVFYKISEKLYQQAGEAAGAQTEGPDDGPIDGDGTEI